MVNKHQKTSNRMNYGILTLMGYYALCWSWTLSTNSLSLSGSKHQGQIIAAIVSVVIVGLSTFIMWHGIKFTKYIISTRPALQSILLALPVLALFDFLVSWLTTIIWIGPEGNINNILPLSSPALILINTPMGFASRILGFFGLAAFGWLIIILLVNKPKHKPVSIVLIILSAVSLVGWLVYRNANGSTFQAKIISETLGKQVPSIQADDTTLVVFPEYGLDGIDNSNLSSRIQTTRQKSFFVGSQDRWIKDKNGHANVLIFGNTRDGITETQNKHRLIPGGEDLSYIGRFVLEALNQHDTLDFFKWSQAIVRGDKQLSPFKLDDTTVVGSAVCSSIISPLDYRQFTKSGATVLTNSASLQIFGGTLMFNREQKSLARFMAIANARYFLQSANGDKAYAIDHNGQTRSQISGHSTTDVTVQNNSKKTIYTQLGEWLVWTGGVVALWIFAIRKGVTKHKKSVQ